MEGDTMEKNICRECKSLHTINTELQGQIVQKEQALYDARVIVEDDLIRYANNAELVSSLSQIMLVLKDAYSTARLPLLDVIEAAQSIQADLSGNADDRRCGISFIMVEKIRIDELLNTLRRLKL